MTLKLSMRVVFVTCTVKSLCIPWSMVDSIHGRDETHSRDDKDKVFGFEMLCLKRIIFPETFMSKCGHALAKASRQRCSACQRASQSSGEACYMKTLIQPITRAKQQKLLASVLCAIDILATWMLCSLAFI